MLDFFFFLTMVLFLLTCVFMILLVLIQKGRGGGLASAFGGMGGNTAFGSKTGDVLTWATSILFGVFLVLAVVLNLLATRRHEINIGAAVVAPAAPQPAQGPFQSPTLPPPPGPPPAIQRERTEPIVPVAPADTQIGQPADAPTTSPAEQPR